MEKILISDAAKQVEVEAHVLRYWEEELKLPIQRNKQGHRFYTKEDVNRFRQIKEMKEQGFQLKAIRNALNSVNNEGEEKLYPVQMAEGKIEKAARLQFLLQGMISQAVQENNEVICRNVKETITKEMDFQFRQQEDSVIMREEEHYKKLDELLRSKSVKEEKKKHKWFGAAEN